MSVSALKKVVIEHLRGCVLPFTLPFEKDKKLTVIYGENATGKTTICDAFEFLANGRVGSLEDRGLGKTSRYWHSVGKSASDVSVTLETGDSSCTARLNKGDVVAVPPAARPRVEVLRRSQILRLIEAEPAKRYAEISRFIDVSAIESSEATLRELVRTLASGRDTAVARVQENADAIRQFWESAGKSIKDPIEWAKQEVARDVSDNQVELQALKGIRTAYQRLTSYPEIESRATEAARVAKTTLDAATKRLEAQLAKAAEGVGELVGILEAARPYLQKYPNPTHCPLCESAEKAEGLTQRIDSRIKQYSSLNVATRDRRAAEQSVTLAEQRLSDIKSNFARDRQAFEEITGALSPTTNVPLPSQPCPADIAIFGDWTRATLHLSEEWGQRESAAQSQSQFVNTLKQALGTYETNVKAQKELDELIPRLERAHEIVVDERRKFTDGVLQAIAAKVGDIYELVHPGEGLNKISLELDPSRRASLGIGANFAGQVGTPPQAYFSQSHLDTLGICIFLALASLEKPEEKVLVLDDVLASVDEPHVERLIEMLYTEVLKFRHCVITTHYRPWKEKLRWGWLRNGQCHFVELTKWTTADGLKLVKSIPDVERLRQLLVEVPPDPQLVCSKAGVILEAALDFLTLLYECRVPRRMDGRHTLGDLLPSLNKKLRDSLRVEVLCKGENESELHYKSISLTPILEELTRIAQARNVFGAHFNALSFEMLESDAFGFGQQVLLLMDALTDPAAGWPRNSKSGSYWATAGESRRLHPLQQPA